MRKKVGASVAQYAIIIALVCISVTGVFYALGDTINEHLANISNFFTGNNVVIAENKKHDSILAGSLEPGSLPGSSLTNPVRECAGDICALDYGEFVLNGIPDDFGTFVETSGTAGGTDLMSDMLAQIADYLEESGDTEGAEEYKQLANLGHYLADVHEIIEQAATYCGQEQGFGFTSSDDGMNCFRDTMLDRHSRLTKNPDIMHLMADIDNYDLEKLIKEGMIIGDAKKEYNDDCIDGVCSHNFLDDADTYPSFAMVQLYESIMANPEYSDDLKAITQELYLNIGDLAYNQAGNSNAAMHHGHYGLQEYDPLTGELIGNNEFMVSDHLFEITNPNASVYTDLDSALICTSSGNSDKNNQCHKDNK